MYQVHDEGMNEYWVNIYATFDNIYVYQKILKQYSHTNSTVNLTKHSSG